MGLSQLFNVIVYLRLWIWHIKWNLLLVVMNYSLIHHVCCATFVPFTLYFSGKHWSSACSPSNRLSCVCCKAELQRQTTQTVWLSNTQLPHLPLYIVVTKARTKPNNLQLFLCSGSECLFVLESLQQKEKGCKQCAVCDGLNLPLFSACAT